MSKPLFIQHRAPYQGYSALETLDALLVAAAFGQNPSVLFQGDGVWQLLPSQEAQLMARASVVAQLEALPLYDVDDIYVDEESLIGAWTRRCATRTSRHTAKTRGNGGFYRSTLPIN